MSAIAENIKPMPVTKPRLMEVTIKGKIDATRRYQAKHYTRLITPSGDAYSRPEIVEIRSDSKLGQRDDEITVTCKLGGYKKKPYAAKDRETGEISQLTPIELTLDCVE